MSVNSFYQNRFPSIQVLRGIASIFIILEHIRFLNCGAFAVDIFFCISGFTIMLSSHENTEHFLQKRFIRILPLYDLMTLGTYLLLLIFPTMFSQTKPNFIHFMKSLLFIPFDIGDGVLQPIVRIGWTINCELFFYILFYISLRISHKYRGLICSTLLLLLVATGQITRCSFIPFRFYSQPVMLEFILGILSYSIAYEIYKKDSLHKLPKTVSYVATLLPVPIFSLLLLTKASVNVLGLRRVFIWGIPAMLIVLCFFVAGLFLKMPKPLVFLGNISFSTYLLHYYPVQLLDRSVFDFSTCTPFSVLGVFLGIFISILLGYCSWLFIEKKLTTYLKKKLLHTS